MFRGLDLSNWQSALTTVLGLLVMMLIMVGIRILMMMTIQARQQRMNRQINERIKTLMAAYKVLGGSFTGRLTVDPSHLRGVRRAAQAEENAADVVTLLPEEGPSAQAEAIREEAPQFIMERRVQIRDAVEAALADILLLGTEEQVRLAGQAARDMAEGRPIHTAELVVSLRSFIRKALDLEDIPADVAVPAQGPTRPSMGGGRGGAGGRGGPGGGGAGGGAGGGGGMGGGGMGMGMGMGLGSGRRGED